MRQSQRSEGKKRPTWDTGAGPFLRELGKRFLIWIGIAAAIYGLVVLFQAIK